MKKIIEQLLISKDMELVSIKGNDVIVSLPYGIEYEITLEGKNNEEKIADFKRKVNKLLEDMQWHLSDQSFG